MKNQKKPLSRQENIVVQELADETLIYDLQIDKAFCLNKTSALIWQMCDGENSVDEISKILSRKLNQTANEDLVWLAIDQLKQEKLLVNCDELESKFEGMKRRDVVKKIGLASMIALPGVAGIIAPTSANAASVVCTSNLTCTCTFASAADAVPAGEICPNTLTGPGRECPGTGCTVCRRNPGICATQPSGYNCAGSCRVS